jgi:hypothetical protein
MRIGWSAFALTAVALAGCDRGLLTPVPEFEDTTPPTITISGSPVFSPFSSGRMLVQLSYTAWDETGVVWTGYEWDDGSVTGSEVAPDTVVHGRKTIVQREGQEAVRLIARDAAGNEGRSEPFIFELDTVPPTVRVQGPPDGSIIRDERVRMHLDAEDASGIWEVRYRVWWMTETGARETYSGSVPVARGERVSEEITIPLKLGMNEIYIEVTDPAQNRTELRHSLRRHPAAAAEFWSVSNGIGRSCGLDSQGQVFCWRDVTWTGEGDRPRPVPTSVRFNTITTGPSHSCGVSRAGGSYCWGFNWLGILGIGNDGGEYPEPQPIANDPGFSLIVMGAHAEHACGLTPEGAAYCWGNNATHQLGTTVSETCATIFSTRDCRTAPTRLPGDLTWKALSVGVDHTCGVTSDGAAYCWGRASHGEFGTGERTATSPEPLPVSGGLRFEQISTGYRHTCGVTTDDVAYCWGYNGDGRLGDGTQHDRYAPTPVAGGLRFRSVGIGESALPHSCGLTTEGRIYCWGNGRTEPTPLELDLTFSSVSERHLCGVSTQGITYCWGAPLEPIPVMAP